MIIGNNDTYCNIVIQTFGGSTTGEYSALSGYTWTIIKIGRKAYDAIWTEFAIRCENSQNYAEPRILLRSSYINGASGWKEITLNSIG